MIVVDIGCARYGGDYSIERLIEEFAPHTLYGFDPAADFPHLLWEDGETTVTVDRAAAWTFDGEIGFRVAGLGGHIDENGPKVKCVDLARFIGELADEEIVLKADCEGGEYQLLDHLLVTGMDARLKLAWIEWHPAGGRVNGQPDAHREAIERDIRCEIVEWRW